MSDIFPLDLTEGCKSLPSNERRPPLHQYSGVKARRNNFSYSKSLSLGHNDIRALPRNFNSFSSAILFKDSRGLPAVQPLQSTESCPGLEDNILNFFIISHAFPKRLQISSSSIRLLFSFQYELLTLYLTFRTSRLKITA